MKDREAFRDLLLMWNKWLYEDGCIPYEIYIKTQKFILDNY